MEKYKTGQIYRFAGEMSFISTLYLVRTAEKNGTAPNAHIDRKDGELTVSTVKWLIREYNEADRRGEIPRSFKNLVSRLQGVLGRGVTFSDIDNLESTVGWDPEKAYEWYNRCRRDIEAKDIIREGCHTSDVRYDGPYWETLGIDGRRWDKWRQNQCYCPQDIVDAVYAAMPVDSSYIQRLCALLSEREPDKWTAMGGVTHERRNHKNPHTVRLGHREDVGDIWHKDDSD